MDQQVYNGSMTSSSNGDNKSDHYVANPIINKPREEDEIQEDLKRHLNIDFDGDGEELRGGSNQSQEVSPRERGFSDELSGLQNNLAAGTPDS